MDRIILMLLVLFLIGFLYSFIIQRLTKSKIIMLIPSMLGVIMLIYNTITSNPNDSDGLEAIRIVIKEFIISTIIVGNISGLIFFTLRKK